MALLYRIQILNLKSVLHWIDKMCVTIINKNQKTSGEKHWSCRELLHRVSQFSKVDVK